MHNRSLSYLSFLPSLLLFAFAILFPLHYLHTNCAEASPQYSSASPLPFLLSLHVLLIPYGATYSEVLKFTGAPSEKIEYETLRKNEWIFRKNGSLDRKITFREGKVIHDSYNKSAPPQSNFTREAASIPRHEVESTPNSPVNTTVLSFSGDDIFQEIGEIKSTPNSTEVNKKDSQAKNRASSRKTLKK